MGDRLWGRRGRVTIQLPAGSSFLDVQGANTIEINGGVGVDLNDPSNLGMRIQFEINKTSEKEPNTSSIVITNLSDTRRGSLNKKGVKFTLDAGYVDTGLTRIHRGDARTIDHIRDAASWNTKAQLGDGERAYRYARVSNSFAGPIGAGQVLQYLGNVSGLQIGNVPTIVADLTTTYDQGYTLHGTWQEEMDALVRSIGYTWSIQNETLQVLPPNASVNTQIPLISPDTGLVDSPEMGTPETKGKGGLIKFKALLMPAKPGGLVHLKSKRYDAEVRVKKCRFVGDTHGGEWYTHFEGIVQSG